MAKKYSGGTSNSASKMYQNNQNESISPDLDANEQPSIDITHISTGRGGGTSSNLGGPLLNFHLQCSLGGASRHLARTR